MTCEDMKKEIENLKKELVKQINDSDIDMQEILKGIVKVSSKYPDQKELIEFIVIFNDSLNRDSKNIKNNIIELIDTCFIYKIKMLDKINEINKNSKTSSFKNKITNVLVSVKNIMFNKLIIPLAIIAFIFFLYILFPEQAEHFFKEIFPKINKIL